MFQRLWCFLINNLWCLLYQKEYKEFLSIKDIEEVQRKKLLNIISNNKTCEYGKTHTFENIKTLEEFQSSVPLTVYEDYKEYIEKIRNGEKNILTTENILFLELYRGDTSGSMLIPYTKSQKEDFQKGIKYWVYDLFSNYKGIKWGKSYWSVSPSNLQFEEDRYYFRGIEKKLFNRIFALPGQIAKEENIDTFYYKNALALLSCKNLTSISVWNPTSFILLLEYMVKNTNRLVGNIYSKNKKRSLEVMEFLEEKAYNKLWKNLKVISCWSDGNAKAYLDKLKIIFPSVTIQPKELHATDGFISFPISEEQGARLSVNSYFFEFEETYDSKIYLAHELEKDKEYAIIITTSGGLYRYKLKDLVMVTGFSGIIPLIKFKKKQDKPFKATYI
ncbi:MAG: GH3 auxin-responsive promoter family protein [Clostridiaceae bacterium]|nr:GH3 auxin-responsive promoter family protein [Clostridiaceae bacterium]